MEVCPYCGFEIGTDDCTCGGFVDIAPQGETRMDYLVFEIAANPIKEKENGHTLPRHDD